MDTGQPTDGVESEHHYHNLVRGSTYIHIYSTLTSRMDWTYTCVGGVPTRIQYLNK